MEEPQIFNRAIFKMPEPELKIKLDKKVGAVLPTKANPTDSGYDMTATSVRWDDAGQYFEYGTGVYLHIPEGYDVRLFPKSSISSKVDLFLANSVAVIDETYRKEILFRFKPTVAYYVLLGLAFNEDTDKRLKVYKVGDQIGQLVMEKKLKYTVTEVEDIEDTDRGGFGSTTRPVDGGYLAELHG